MDIITRLNWVDVVVIIIMLRISYVAFQDGLSHEIFPLIGVTATVTLALHYYIKLGFLISQNIAKISVYIAELLGFILLILAVGFVFKFIRVIVNKIIKISWHPLIDRFGGLMAGMARAAMVASTVLIIIALIPAPYFQRSIRNRSLTGMYFLRIAPAVYDRLSPLLPAVKIGPAAIDRDNVVAEIIADKSLDAGVKKVKKTPEWEKAVKF